MQPGQPAMGQSHSVLRRPMEHSIGPRPSDARRGKKNAGANHTCDDAIATLSVTTSVGSAAHGDGSAMGEAPSLGGDFVGGGLCDDWTERIIAAIGQRNYDHWFRGPSRWQMENRVAVVRVASDFLRNWLQKTFGAALQKVAVDVLGEGADVAFRVDASLANSATELGRTAARSSRRLPRSEERRAGGSSPENPATPRQARAGMEPVAAAADRVLSMALSTSTARSTETGRHSKTAFPALPAAAPRRLRLPKNTATTEGDAAPVSRLGRSLTRTEARESRLAPSRGLKETPDGDVERENGPASPPSEPLGSKSAVRSSESSRPSPQGGTPAEPAVRSCRRLLDLADFVAGAGNELGLTAALQVGDAPGLRYNPLYLHGNVGTGKTHLLEGIYRRLRKQHPQLQVVLLSAEAFANHFTEALRQRTLPAFRQRFRAVDALLIDDLDFFDGKQVFQEEFLHTFKQLEVQGRQVVVTADRHPRLLTGVADDLVSRLVSGLVCRLENPDLDTRRKIVAHKSARMEHDVAPEALNLIAERLTGSVRELEGALHTLSTWHAMTGRRVTLSAARTALADLERDCVRIVRLGDVEQTVCRFFGVSSDDLRSAGRGRTLSQPRMLAMYLARRLTQSAYNEIGRHFGGRNHSTVMSAERKVEQWRKDATKLRVASQNWNAAELIETLEQQLRVG